MNLSEMSGKRSRRKYDPDVSQVPWGAYCCGMRIIIYLAMVAAATLSLHAQSRRADSLALVDFYRAMKGAEWVEDSNWVSEAPLELWHGVTTSEEGRVAGVRLPSNNLVGFLPFSIGQLNYLEVLDLSSNRIGGEFPVPINKLVNLVELNLNDNVMKCDLPITLASCFSLRVLRLARNEYLGELPYNFADLTRLEVIDLSGNKLTGPLPFDIGRITNLRVLRASNNQLSGSLPSSIGSLSALEILDLANNKIIGSLPGTVGGCFDLQEVYLQNNRLNDTLTGSIGVLRKLRRLNLQQNAMVGSIPTTIGGCRALEHLNLSSNALTGAVPVEIGQCVNLIELNLSVNKLVGPLPEELTACKALRSLVLSENAFGGEIPSWLDSLRSLEVLALANINAFGEMPESLGRLDSLRVLDIRSNALVGSVPESYRGLDSLTTIRLSSNDLVGGLSNLPRHTYALFAVQDNRFDFSDIVPVIERGNPRYIYAPQDSLGVAIDTLVEKGTTYTITVETDDIDTNVYTWYKDGVVIPDIRGRDLVINPVRHSDSGLYTCTITNVLAPDLTLFRRPVLVRVEPDEPDDTTSVMDDELRRSISLSPQPASTHLTIRRTSIEPYSVDVVDVRGVVVVPEVRAETSTHHVGTSNLSRGVYFVRIRTRDAGTAIPVVIE